MTASEPNLLLVDDEPHVVAGLKTALRRHPFRVWTALSGAEALELLKREPIDVVISDERMPGMDGAELLREVRRRFPDTLRMLLTGQASLEEVIRAVNDGQITHYFAKPCSADEVARVVGQALRLREIEGRSAVMARSGAATSSEDQRRRALLRDLEIAHPGITDVQRDASGAVIIDDVD